MLFPCDGAFYLSGSDAYDGQNGNNGYRDLKFDAARVSGVYSKSATVQPAAFQIFIMIKIWSAFGWTLDPLYVEFDALAVNFISYIEKWVPSEIVLYK